MSEPPQNQTKDDKELLILLTKLYGIQEEVGAKPKSSEQEKFNRASNTASMGRGKKAKQVGSRFVELKSSIVTRLKSIHALLEEEQERARANFSIAANNPKEIIARQARIREEIRQAGDDWTDLDAIYKNEARKRKSKFTSEELDVQQTLVQRLYSEIQKVKELSSKNYATRANGTDERDQMAIEMNAKNLNVVDLSGGMNGNGALTQGNGFLGGGGGSGEVELTHHQSLQMQQIESRDQDFDKQLEEIGEGLQDLAEIAQLQNEEVRRQNLMLDNVGNKLDGAQEHLTNINAKIKDTLDSVRGADKICVDIMCIVMMVGLGAVLYQLIKKNGF